jgi:hypothetical protein
VSLLDDLKKDYNDSLASGEKITIVVPGSEGPYHICKTITANRKNNMLVAKEQGDLAFAAAVLINSLRTSNGEYALKGMSVTKLTRDVKAQVVEAVALEIVPHIFGEDDTDQSGAALEEGTKELDIARKNSKTVTNLD